jgi:hypothetical protein
MHNNNSINNHSEEIMTKENKILREEAHLRNEKLEILYNLLINLQHSIMNRTSSITVLYNLDAKSLRTKINELQDEIFELLNKNNINIRQLNNINFPNENFNGNNTMKSNLSQYNPMKSLKDLNEEKEKEKEKEKMK